MRIGGAILPLPLTFSQIADGGDLELKMVGLTTKFNKMSEVTKTTIGNVLLAEVPKRDFEWVCNECNFPNLTSSVSEDEIEMELHSCINCGCFEMHKRYFR